MSLADLFGSMNWLAIGAAAVTFIVGFLLKQSIYSKLKDSMKDIEELVHDFNEGNADDKWTKEELEEVIGDIKHIVSDYVPVKK